MNLAVNRLPNLESAATSAIRVIQPVPDLIRKFPTTRYYGSKRKLLNWMHGHLGAIRFETALDAFGGTGSVSLLLKAMRKHVTYHDGLKFNEDVARTVLAGSPALNREEVAQVLGAVKPCEGVISKNFSGIFFKNEENSWLDGLFESLNSHNIEGGSRSLLMYLIYQACLKKRPFNLFHRANLTLRTNQEVRRSFGNAVTWERSFIDHSLRAHDELAAMPHLDGPKADFLHAGDPSLLKSGYDLVYIDPPYINREDRYNRDDYWRRYHFLEGLSRYEEWGELVDRNSDIRLFQPPEWFSAWGRATTFKDCLYGFIDNHKNSIVVMSYVSGAIPTEIELIEYFESRFSRVSVHSAAYSHALSKTPKRELLFIGLP